jgi:predicted PurR-regulated permease PerM
MRALPGTSSDRREALRDASFRPASLTLHWEPMSTARSVPPSFAYASWILSGAGLVLVLVLQLLPAMLAGMLVYELIHVMAPAVSGRLSDKRAKLIAVVMLSALITAVTTAAIAGVIIFFRSDEGSIPALLTKMADIVAGSRGTLPSWLVDQMPASPDEMRSAIVAWFRVHAAEMQSMGKEVGKLLIYALIGMIVGAMIALREALPMAPRGPLAVALIERIANLGEVFRRVVFAQVRISLLNTILTGIYLALVLPLFGVKLPLAKTLIAVTFITGLLPVIGNLISNTVIVIVALSYSPAVAIASLGFLIVIHKLEYFLNARIVGRQLGSHAWELLLAMLVMEAAFGIGGVIAAPIYYAFVKDELAKQGML